MGKTQYDRTILREGHVLGQFLGEVLCDRWNLDALDVFSNQFILSRQSEDTIAGFAQFEVDGWHVSHGEKMYVCQGANKDKSVRVVLFGVAVDPKGILLKSTNLSRCLAKCETYDAVVDYLIHCAGRYAFFISSGEVQRFYGDPGNTLGFVYNDETGVVASSVNAAIQRRPTPNSEYPFARAAGLNQGPRFAFGHTFDQHVRRPLANHYLDLNSMSCVRFWPTDDLNFELAEDDNEGQMRALDVFISRHQQVIATLAREFTPTILPLSSGHETRILLACAEGCLPDIDYLFSHATNQATLVDVQVGHMLAKAMGRDMKEIFGADPGVLFDSEQEQQNTLRGINIAASLLPRASLERPEEIAVARAVPKGGVLLRGYVTDLLKAVLWERGIDFFAAGQPHSDVHGLKMMFLSGNSRKLGKAKFGQYWKDPWFQSAYENWRESVPQNGQKRLYDFAFMEDFQPHGHGKTLYRMRDNFYIGPGNDRTCVQAAISLPPTLRRKLYYHQVLSERLAPALNAVPYAEDVKQLSDEQRAEMGIDIKGNIHRVNRRRKRDEENQRRASQSD